MANRIIKESICTSEQIDELGWFEETFFYRLLVNCDDYGVMDARPKILKAKLFPLKDLTEDKIIQGAKKLIQAGLIQNYTVDGRPYIQVTKWADHQRMRISKHKYPGPDAATGIDADELRDFAAICGESPRGAAESGVTRAREESESNPNPNPNPKPNSAKPRKQDPAFDDFYAAYPKKVAKQDAIKAWTKLKPEADLVARIMQGLARWKESDEWTRDDGRYIPHPATWLNGRRWEDEVQPRRGHVPAQQYGQRSYEGEQEDAMRRMLREAGA